MSDLAYLERVDQACDAIRQHHANLRNARPLIRLWMNANNDIEIPDENGTPTYHPAAGAQFVGRIDIDDTIKGSFPFKNNTPTQGTLELRDDHYMAIWLKKLPNDETLRKNIIITVDFFGGEKRWSGMLDKWEIKTRDGVKYIELTFQDDLTFLQYLLCPPNPFLPIPLFQFPRIFMLAGPAIWAASMTIFSNLARVEGNRWVLPDDPFDYESWDDAWDWSDWQVHIMAPSFMEDTSLWTFISSRMNPVDSIIADCLDDAQLTIKYRRYITEGDNPERCSPNKFVKNVKNLALVFEIVDNSNIASADAKKGPLGTATHGNVVSGFVRSVREYGSGFVEDVLRVVSDENQFQVEEYALKPLGFIGTVPSHPWLVIRDNEWSPIQTSSLSWGPSKNVSVIVGGDNPATDAIAKLTIETIGNLLGALILFSSLGTVIADIVMPFLVGTIAAWLYWRNRGRAKELGWIHYLEAFQTGAEANAWSLSSIASLRGGFLASKSETHHVMELRDSWVIPGVHADIGHRVGSTLQSKGLEDIIWVNQLEEMTADWDNTIGSEKPYSWTVKVGRSERAMSLGERLARLTKKISEAANNVGLSLIQG